MPFTLNQRAILSAAAYEVCYLAFQNAPRTTVIGWANNKEKLLNFPYNRNRVMQNSAGPVTYLMIHALQSDLSTTYEAIIDEKVYQWSNTLGRRAWAQQILSIDKGQLIGLMALTKAVQLVEYTPAHKKHLILGELKKAAAGHETTAAFLFHLVTRLKYLGYYHPKDSVICGIKAGVQTEAIEYYSNFEKMEKETRKIRIFISSASIPVPPYYTFELGLMEKMNRLSLQKPKSLIKSKPKAQFLDSYPYNFFTLAVDMAFAILSEISEAPESSEAFMSDTLLSKLTQRNSLLEALEGC